MTAYGFIQAEKASFPIAMMCEVLGVSRSGFVGPRAIPPGVSHDGPPRISATGSAFSV